MAAVERTAGVPPARPNCGLLLLAGLIFGAGSDCRKWKPGMSVRLSQEITANQFRQWKKTGIEAVEFGISRVDTPDAAAGARQRSGVVRQWADQAQVDVWSLHIPYARDLDISTTDETQRLQIVRRSYGTFGFFTLDYFVCCGWLSS